MKKLIVEVWKQTGLKALKKDGTPEGMMLVEGVLGRVDSMNRNKRFYPAEEYAKHVKDLTRRIAESNGLLGEMEHPKSMNINLNNVSHKLMSIRIDEDGYVRGEIMLLDTPKGKIAQSVVRSGSPLPISSRGLGRTDESGKTILEYMATFDLVGTAGFAETGLTPVSENKDDAGNVISECYEYTLDSKGDVVTEDAFNAIAEAVEQKLVLKYDKLLSESNQSTLTEEKISEMISEKLVANVDQIQSFINEGADGQPAKAKEEKPAGVKDGQDGKELTNEAVTKSQVLEMIQNQFLTVHTSIIEDWAVNHMLPKAAEIQEQWLKTEFSASLCEGLEKWMFETVLPKNAEVQEQWLHDNFKTALLEGIEKWMFETVLPKNAEVQEQWLRKDFTKDICEGIENYIKAEGSKIEKPADVKNGQDGKELTNEGDKLEKPDGIKDGQDGKELTNEDNQYSVSSSILESVNTLINEAKSKKTTETDDENEEETETEEEKNAKNEAKLKLEQELASAFYLSNMPNKFKHLYECLDSDKKASIRRQASTRMLNTVEDVSNFWHNLDLTNESLQFKEGQRAYFRTIAEARGDLGTDARSNLAQLAESMR